jgi:hypothetical protein
MSCRMKPLRNNQRVKPQCSVRDSRHIDFELSRGLTARVWFPKGPEIMLEWSQLDSLDEDSSGTLRP